MTLSNFMQMFGKVKWNASRRYFFTFGSIKVR